MRPLLNRELVLEAPVRVADGAGGFSESWAALGTLWAEVSARTGRERDAGGVAVAQTGYRIVVRGAPVGAPSRPMPDQRFREGARVFRIEAVAERDGGGRYLTCFAREEALA
ncbi:tail protein [Oceanicola sp. 22II-s10i]|uniref:head-tail adaptor protein n=1 Tax=Oceanicola sp. 22II-s10i TaxID=1317116 RepID=UPI000B5227C4|nr:head-tail adaptor protein [Oceanicola sp. 22II-s10i]OWU85309.1 tail protein [Oceanicola sp. 22II-s10i]